MRADQLSITIKSLKLKQRHFSALIYDNNCYVISSPYLPTVPKLHAKDFVELYCKLIRNSKIRSIIEANFPRIPTKIHKYNADFIVISDSLTKYIDTDAVSAMVTVAMSAEDPYLMMDALMLAYTKNFEMNVTYGAISLPSLKSREALNFITITGNNQIKSRLRRLLLPPKSPDLRAMIGDEGGVYTPPAVIRAPTDDNGVCVPPLTANAPNYFHSAPLLNLSIADINKLLQKLAYGADRVNAFDWLTTLQESAFINDRRKVISKAKNENSVVRGESVDDHATMGKHTNRTVPIMNPQPNQETYSILLESAAQDSSWGHLFYVLSVMRQNNQMLSNEDFEMLIEKCALYPNSRWEYSKQLLVEKATLFASSKSLSAKTIGLSLETIRMGCTNANTTQSKHVGVRSQCYHVIDTWNRVQSALRESTKSTSSSQNRTDPTCNFKFFSELPAMISPVSTVFGAASESSKLSSLQHDSSSEPELNTKLELMYHELIDDNTVTPLGLAAVNLGRGDIVLKLLLPTVYQSWKAVQKDGPQPTSEATVSDAISTNRNGCASSHEGFSGLSELIFDELVMQADIVSMHLKVGIAISWFLSQRRVDLAKNLWDKYVAKYFENLANKRWRATRLEHTNPTVITAANSSMTVQLTIPRDPRHDILLVVCRSMLYLDVPQESFYDMSQFLSHVVYSHYFYIKEKSQNLSPAELVEAQIVISPELCMEMIELFGINRNTQEATILFIMFHMQATKFPPTSTHTFSTLSRMVLAEKDYKTVLQLLQMYLKSWDDYSVRQGTPLDETNEQSNDAASAGGMRKKIWVSSKNPVVKPIYKPPYKASVYSGGMKRDDITVKLNANIFSPALRALAELKEVDAIITLLQNELPGRGLQPLKYQIVSAMNTLNKSGNYARAVELFFAFFNDREEIESMKKQRKNSDVIPRNNQTTDLNVSDDADKVVNISNNEDTQSADLHQKSNLKQRSSTVLEWNETVLLAALTSCANGRLGQDGLDILYLLKRRVQSRIRLEAGQLLKYVSLVVKALCTKQNIELLPQILPIVYDDSFPRIMTHDLLLWCVAATVVTENDVIAKQILTMCTTQGYLTDTVFIRKVLSLAETLNTIAPLEISEPFLDSMMKSDVDYDDDVGTNSSQIEKNTISQQINTEQVNHAFPDASNLLHEKWKSFLQSNIQT